LHADQQSTRCTPVALSFLNYIIDVPPSTEIKISHAEIASPSDCQSVAQAILTCVLKEFRLDVVEDRRHESAENNKKLGL
jgi:hypothetical protein